MIKFVLATVVLYIAKTYAAYPQAKKIPPINPGIPDFFIESSTLSLQLKDKNINIVIEKNKDLQNNICQSVAPSKDLTINPPKLKLQAPKKTNIGPGIFMNKFILFDLKYFEFQDYKV